MHNPSTEILDVYCGLLLSSVCFRSASSQWTLCRTLLQSAFTCNLTAIVNLVVLFDLWAVEVYNILSAISRDELILWHFFPQVPLNGAPQFSEGPVNADFSGVLQVNRQINSEVFWHICISSVWQHSCDFLKDCSAECRVCFEAFHSVLFKVLFHWIVLDGY